MTDCVFHAAAATVISSQTAKRLVISALVEQLVDLTAAGVVPTMPAEQPPHRGNQPQVGIDGFALTHSMKRKPPRARHSELALRSDRDHGVSAAVAQAGLRRAPGRRRGGRRGRNRLEASFRQYATTRTRVV